MANVAGCRPWQLKEGADYDILYAIDDQPPVEVKAHAVIDNSVHIPLGPEFASTDLLRRGNRISIRTAQQIFSFDLSGSARALDAMRNCARRWLGLRDASNPRSKSNDVSSASDPDIPQRMGGSLSEFFHSAKVGPWTIDAHSNFMNHAFTYCSATAPDTGAYRLIIDLDRRQAWRMDILNSGWHLNLGAPLEVRYSIDDGPVVRVQGQSIIEQMTTVWAKGRR